MKIMFRSQVSVALQCLIAGFLAFLITSGNFKIEIIPVVLFSIMFLFATLRDVVVTSGEVDIGMSPIAAPVIGSAVVFYTQNSPLSFFVALLVTAIYPPNIIEKKWNYLAFNVSNDFISASGAFITLGILNFSVDAGISIVIAKIIAAVCVFEFISYFILVIDSAIRKEPWKEILYDARKSLIEVLPLAVFSGLLGKFYFDFGPMMLVLFVVPLFFGRELAASYAAMQETQKSTLDTLTRTLEAKDKYTAGHVERVAKFAKYIGEELGYGPKRLERLRQAALLHDAGKLIVPSALLNKPGKLTDEEFRVIQRHEFVTIEILKSIDFLSSIAHVAGGDHNSMEGKSTKKLEPFIVAACDAFDAMTSTRSYRKALSMEIAFEELNKKGGKQFHPKVVEALINAIESRGEHYGDGYETDIVHEDAPEAGVGSAGIGDLADEKEVNSVPLSGSGPLDQVTETAPHAIPSVLRTSVTAEHSEEIVIPKETNHE